MAFCFSMVSNLLAKLFCHLNIIPNMPISHNTDMIMVRHIALLLERSLWLPQFWLYTAPSPKVMFVPDWLKESSTLEWSSVFVVMCGFVIGSSIWVVTSQNVVFVLFFYMVVVLCIHLNLLIDIYIYNIQEDSMRKFGEFGSNILDNRRLYHLKRKMAALYWATILKQLSISHFKFNCTFFVQSWIWLHPAWSALCSWRPL